MASPKKRKHIVRKIILLVLFLALLGIAVYVGITMLKNEYTVSYSGYTATRGSISNSLSFSGNLSLIDSQSYTSNADTTVRKVYVNEGDSVKEGDKLVRLANGKTFTADFDGTVNVLSVNEDDEVVSGDELVQIADFSHMKVTLRVDEYDISSVSVGSECTITVTATENKYESSIASIDYISASSGSVAYYSATAYVEVGPGDYPGMQVTAQIPQEQADDVVILKMDALSFDETNSAYVYMYNDAGDLEAVSVEVGVSNGNYVEIVSGLEEGDEVYVEVEQDESASGLGGLLSGLFSGRQVSPPSGFGGGSGMPSMDDMPFSGGSGDSPFGGFDRDRSGD